MNVLIKFKKLNQICIRKIMNEMLGYSLNKFEEDTGRDNFLFGGDDFLHKVRRTLTCSFPLDDLDTEVRRVASKIYDYPFVSDVALSWEGILDRYTIEVRGEADCFGSYGNRFYGGFIDESFDPDSLRKYFEGRTTPILDAYKRDTTHLRIPKTFDVYSGYSKDGRLRTVVHWQDGEKTSVYLKEDDLKEDDRPDLYLAIAYCYVKRKFGTMSHFKRIVERNTKDVTANVKRFVYGGDSQLIPMAQYSIYSIYDLVALYLATSYLGDTDQWLTEEDIKRLEDSINE